MSNPTTTPRARMEEMTYDLNESPGYKRMLILEDDTDLSMVLKEYLEGLHFKVTCVQNGLNGLKEVMAGDFDVILCDLLMPNLPGDMFYIAVQRTRPQLCKRFIFMTGHKGEPKIDAFVRSIKGLTLWKPFQLYELADAIKVVERRVEAPDSTQ